MAILSPELAAAPFGVTKMSLGCSLEVWVDAIATDADNSRHHAGWPTRMRFTVTSTLAVAELGTVAFIGLEPITLAFGSRHRVLVTRPDGESVEAVASVEAVRKDSLAHEFPALLFASLAAGVVVLGSSIAVLGEVPS